MMTPEEREVALKQMTAAKDEFYKWAVNVRNHPFIEFAGLMHEYIQIARGAQEEGIDFSDATAHHEIALPIKNFQADYLGEKFDCIFGPMFRQNPEAWEIFKRRMEGRDA